MKYTLTTLLATFTLTTFVAVALARAIYAQTNPAVTNPAATPAANQGKPKSETNSADGGVKQKVEDAVTRKLKSFGVKDLKSVETKAFGKVFGHHKRNKKAVKKLPLAQQAGKDRASSV